MKSCFGYVRVSTQKQGEGVSLEAQRDAIEHFASRNNVTITEWFSEKETAAKSGRPIFNGMIKALRRGKAAGLVMHKIDRSARNFADWAKIGELADAGIDVHFATETLDFRSRGGRLSADIQAVIAADYIRNLREETIKGITGRLKQGLYPFAAPIGYLDNGGGKVKTPDPVSAPLIKQAFELYASGRHSIRSLTKEMNRRGLRNGHRKPVTKTGLETILGNPFYIGLIRIKRTGATYPGIHDALIPVSLFDTVQYIKAGKARKKVTRHNHTYRGLFRCHSCQRAMIPELQKGHVYYRCQTPSCPTNCVREEALESAIIETLSRLQLSDEAVASLTTEITTWLAERQHGNETKSITLQLASLRERLDRLTDALIDRLIDRDAFNRRKGALHLEQARLKEERQKAERAADDPQRVRKFLELIKNLALTYISAIPIEKREIVAWATSNRRVERKNIYLEPANWLSVAEAAIAGLIGAPDRPTSRRRRRVRKLHVEQLIEAANSEEIANVIAELDQVTKKDTVIAV